MGGLALKWLLGGGWKTILGAVVIGGLIVGIATLYAGFQIEKGLAMKYKAERDAARTLTSTYKSHLNACVEVNDAWVVTAEEWNRRVDELTASSESFRARFASERAWRRTLAAELEASRAAADAAITATDCEGALNQLIESLGWGGAL